LRKLERRTAGDSSFISRSQSEEPHNPPLEPIARSKMKKIFSSNGSAASR
jgi:hypothetical protein